MNDKMNLTTLDEFNIALSLNINFRKIFICFSETGAPMFTNNTALLFNGINLNCVQHDTD